jgi:hypothetical protein
MTVKRSFATNFTGGNSASLPFLNHSVGVAGCNHRWMAVRQSPADGAALASFAPTVGTIPLSSNGTAPTMQTDEFGNRCVRFDGVDDILSAGGVSDVQTIVVIARVKAATGTDQGIVHAGGAYANRTTTDTTRILVTGQSAKFAAANPNQPKYHMVAIAANGATSRYAVDGVSAEIGATTGVLSEVTLGRASTAIFGNIEVYEAFTFPTGLTLADLTAVRAAMTAKYGTTALA